jgi:hypothetical protein
MATTRAYSTENIKYPLGTMLVSDAHHTHIGVVKTMSFWRRKRAEIAPGSMSIKG